jgi:hypothetical protein
LGSNLVIQEREEMKILVTGCTASQSSHNAISRYPTFTGLIHDAFVELGHEVFLTKPHLSYSKEFLDRFDLIFVGLASPSNLSAHYSYGAFALANKAKELGKLRLIVDMPEPQKIRTTIRDFNTGTDSFYKDFYSKRLNYDTAIKQENKEQIMSFIDYLHNNKWAQTYVPSMPWFSKKVVTENIPNLDEENIVPLCFDRVLIDESEDRLSPVHRTYWCADNPKSSWTKKISANLILPIESIRHNNYTKKDAVQIKMQNSVGTLISTYQGGEPWWSVAISQSLVAGVPVVTEWRHTAELGAEWAYLPSTIEEMSPEERLIVAQTQKDFYREAVPSYTDSLEKTTRALDNQSQLLLV